MQLEFTKVFVGIFEYGSLITAVIRTFYVSFLKVRAFLPQKCILELLSKA